EATDGRGGKGILRVVSREDHGKLPGVRDQLHRRKGDGELKDHPSLPYKVVAKDSREGWRVGRTEEDVHRGVLDGHPPRDARVVPVDPGVADPAEQEGADLL